MGTRSVSEPHLTVAALVRNEEGRFWESALEAWFHFATRIVVLDDDSTDNTKAIACPYTPHVYQRFASGAWGNEAPARAELWHHACQHTPVGGYVMILDADMVPARDPRPLLAASPDAIAFPLYDLWSANEYRCDGQWQGHRYPRIWLVKRVEEPAEGWQWNQRGIHTGHLPLNLPLERVVYAPQDFSLLHMAYSTPELRQQKHAQYMSVAKQLTDFERLHAESILDPDPMLSPLSFTPQYTLRLAHES